MMVCIHKVLNKNVYTYIWVYNIHICMCHFSLLYGLFQNEILLKPRCYFSVSENLYEILLRTKFCVRVGENN